jgi:PAS domain S-box-containing protein
MMDSMENPAVLVVNAAGVIQSWSQRAEELLGHQEAAVRGKTLDIIVPAEFRERHWAGFRRAMSTGTSFIDGQAAILPVLCGDGQVRRFAGRLSLLRDASDRVVGAMALYVEPNSLTSELPVLGG